MLFHRLGVWVLGRLGPATARRSPVPGGVWKPKHTTRTFRPAAKAAGRVWRSRVSDVLYKPASSERTYVFDFSAFPEVKAGETLSSPVVTISPSGGVSVSVSASVSTTDTQGDTGIISTGKCVLVELTGGSKNLTYSVECKVNTSAGAVLTIQGYLAVT